MRIIERGHKYELLTKENNTVDLTFFKGLPYNLSNHDGVLCQEVIRALIDRVIELNNQKPCHESVDIINHLRSVLVLFEIRAVRGTLEKSYAKCGLNIEQIPIKPNGHIFDLLPESFNFPNEEVIENG